MPRAVVPLALVLALVTGVALEATRVVVLSPGVVRGNDPASMRNAAVVRQFYAAVNDAVATGNFAGFDEVVGRDLVVHPAGLGDATDKSSLVRTVRSMRTVAPALRLAVLDLTAQDERAAARVQVDGGEWARFLGHPVAADSLWGTVDFFRVVGGQIVEYWGGLKGFSTYDHLLTVPIPVQKPTRKALTLERWSYAPNASEPGTTDLSFLILLVDTGSLRVDLHAAAGPTSLFQRGSKPGMFEARPLAPGSGVTLARGDALVFSQRSRFEVRNAGTVPAEVLAVVAAVPSPQTGVSVDAQPPTGATGIMHTVLARSLAVNLAVTGTSVSIGRAELAPGDALPTHAVAIAEMAAVESGELLLTADGAGVWVTDEFVGGMQHMTVAVVPAGGGTFGEAARSVAYRPVGESPLGIVLIVFSDAPHGE